MLSEAYAVKIARDWIVPAVAIDGEKVPAPDPRAVGVVQAQPQLASAGERRKKEDAPQ